MYLLGSLLLTLLRFSVRLLNVLFNPNIGENHSNHAPHTTRLSIVETNDQVSSFKRVVLAIIGQQANPKKWIIFVVNHQEVHYLQKIINQIKPFKHLIVTIKSDEAKYWAIEQSLGSKNCSAVVIFNKKQTKLDAKLKALVSLQNNSQLIVLNKNPILQNSDVRAVA